MKIFLFKKLNKDIQSLIYKNAKEIGMFLSNKEVEIKECDSMVPLTERTAGSVMTPLKYS